MRIVNIWGKDYEIVHEFDECRIVILKDSNGKRFTSYKVGKNGTMYTLPKVQLRSVNQLLKSIKNSRVHAGY